MKKPRSKRLATLPDGCDPRAILAQIANDATAPATARVAAAKALMMADGREDKPAHNGAALTHRAIQLMATRRMS